MKVDACKSCGKPIVWLLTVSSKPMPVDAETVTEGDTRYVDGKHTSHIATCPHSKQWRKPKEQAPLFREGNP